MESTPSSVSVVIKIAAMFILTFIELILNSFVEASFSLSSQSIFYINFYFIVTIMLSVAHSGGRHSRHFYHDAHHDVADFPIEVWSRRTIAQIV